mmetsp:Transcript_75975/g.180714  ORF Transcript_75975/g.180714 Transcript_75975/m.180714 type:complete len:167 (-) Transcript_75975:210-710(-)|eukprot:CAMPEP_0178420990 /NCGR_PEP_ID=MMETSP0689_2-20121128/26419_1 /TAXON_ID=160604 /ORGANISM="Amphidinium massartii, Strain CS-259" /LENGTH=166 /DNA_ID=CAMNT_0020042493 /DNA_START=109 /DNA_END=609 /DNA_ORIENTATION=-
MDSAQGLAKRAEAFLKQVRKWDVEFLCIGGKGEGFTVPKPDDVLIRMTANLNYFSANYLICFALFVLVAIVVLPQLLVLVCIFGGMWYALSTRPAHFTIEVGTTKIMKRQMQYGLAGFNALVVLIFARTMIFATIGASFLFILGHAVLHNVPTKAKDKGASDDQEP